MVDDREMQTERAVISSSLVGLKLKMICAFAAGSRIGYFVLVLGNGLRRNKGFDNLVPRSLVDEAEGEIWESKKICFS